MATISRETAQEQERVIPVMPADWVPGPHQGGWTYEMYAALPDDGRRYEVVQGVLMMSPAPEVSHQGIIQRISRYLDERIFTPHLGLVLTGPTDVKLAIDTVVQPDVLVLLKEHLARIQEKHIAGNPDLAVEVISPGSATYDRLVKYHVYEQAGVPEYWLVNSKKQTVEVFVLEGSQYRSPGALHGEQLLQSKVIPEPAIPVGQFFDWTGGLF